MRIIYLSGIDGCGKTTQAKLLVDQLQRKGMNAQYLWFRWRPSFRRILNRFRTGEKKPTSKKAPPLEQENTKEEKWMKFKKRILANQLLRNLWLFYACSDYYFYYKKHFNKFAADVIVIDRYLNDFIIDQAVNLDIAHREISVISDNFFLKKFHLPDFIIIIDLPALEGYTRKSDGTSLSYLETREKYYKALNGNDTLHIDGLKSIEELASEIATWTVDKLKKRTR